MKKLIDSIYGLYALSLIIITLFISGYQNCQAQNKQSPQKIILETELNQVIKLKIPKNLETLRTEEEPNKIKQKYPSKDNTINLKNKSTIPKVDAIIREEDYYENNK